MFFGKILPESFVFELLPFNYLKCIDLPICWSGNSVVYNNKH